MALVTPPQLAVPRQTARSVVAHKANVVAAGGAIRASGDYPKLVLIGEPGSGWRAVFDIVPGGRVLVGRPNHASRNMSSVAYLPSRAVSRMHAVISMEADGNVYLTHTKATNLTWRADDSVWSPMRPGDRTMLQHTDTLCFGMAPKTRNYVNKVDTPFVVSIAIAPRGEPVNKFQFVRKTIHRPSSFSHKAKELDPTMQLLMNGLDGLNVSLDRQTTEVKQEGEEEATQPGEKRKRGSADEAEPEASGSGGAGGDTNGRHSMGDSPSSTTRSTRPLRKSPTRTTTSLSNSTGSRPLPTARSVFGLSGSTSLKKEDGVDSGAANDTKKRRVIEPGELERVYCGDANDLPESLTNMTLS